MRVLLADDNTVLREEIAQLLADEPDIQIVGQASHGKMAIDLTRQLMPEIVLMDLSMPVMNGLAATRTILSEFPQIRVIGLSMYEDTAEGQLMRKAGAAAFVCKASPRDFAASLMEAIRAPKAQAAPDAAA
jgi:two-component system, NarL family, response regulator LiaR